MGQCSICGGEKREDTTTFTVDFGGGVIVVRDVPATVCQQCGEDRVSDEVAEALEEVVNKARDKQTEVEVIKYAA